MDTVAINHDILSGVNVALKPATFWSGPKLYVNDELLKGKRGTYVVKTQNGSNCTIKLKYTYFDPIPKIDIDGQIIKLVDPLKWYQYLWMGLPIIIAVDHGLFSKLIGLSTVRMNLQIFRGDKKPWIKYLHTGILSLSAAAAYISIVMMILNLVKH